VKENIYKLQHEQQGSPKTRRRTEKEKLRQLMELEKAMLLDVVKQRREEREADQITNEDFEPVEFDAEELERKARLDPNRGVVPVPEPFDPNAQMKDDGIPF